MPMKISNKKNNFSRALQTLWKNLMYYFKLGKRIGNEIISDWLKDQD